MPSKRTTSKRRSLGRFIADLATLRVHCIARGIDAFGSADFNGPPVCIGKEPCAASVKCADRNDFQWWITSNMVQGRERMA
jgi:hypothetical protein